MITWWLLLLTTVLSLAATLYVRPQVIENFRLRPWGWIVPIGVFVALVMMKIFLRKGRVLGAFLSSTAYIAAMLGGAAFAMYPYLLPASTDPSFSLTIYNSKTGPYSLSIGLIWWVIGMVLAVAYFTFIYRSFSGKVQVDEGAY